MRKLIVFLATLLSIGLSHAGSVSLQQVASGFSSPLAVRNAGDGSNRLFVVEQGGRIRLIDGAGPAATDFLNISALTNGGGERGLLGLAFHPNHAANGLFFINYTNTSGNTVIARYEVMSADPNQADPASATILMTINQDFSNHNGGDLHFGPDGYLYIGMGDGGDGGDPNNRAQDPGQLLGKMLRIDVDNPGANVGAGVCGAGVNYGIPADNPFIGDDGAGTCDEIWALGMRNPFRFSFDRATGDLWIGDVGQGRREEVDLEPFVVDDPDVPFLAGFEDRGGLNYGWDCREGTTAYGQGGDPGSPSPLCADVGPLTDPVMDYSSAGDGGGRCSVTGGYRYRGTIAELSGRYIYGDYCTGEVFLGTRDPGGWTMSFLMDAFFNISGFGEDEAGELYVTSLNGGSIHQFQSP